MPAGYVRALFDQYARHYDLSLLEGLDYRGPQLLFDAVMAACARSGASAVVRSRARSRLRHRAWRARRSRRASIRSSASISPPP